MIEVGDHSERRAKILEEVLGVCFFIFVSANKVSARQTWRVKSVSIMIKSNKQSVKDELP